MTSIVVAHMFARNEPHKDDDEAYLMLKAKI
jgi:hypothetical protein